MTVTIETSDRQSTASYQFDKANKLTQVSQNDLTTKKQFTDPVGRLQNVVLPNGLTVTYGYDEASNVTSLTYGTLGFHLGV